MKKFQWLALFGFIGLSLSLFTSTGCNKDDDDDQNNEEELITTLLLSFVETGGATSTFTFEDLDGVGGNAPTIQNINLQAGKTYTLSVAFFDKSEAGHVHDVTEEVLSESAAHLVCFSGQGAAPTVVIQDTDANGKPLGLVSQVVVGAAGTGKLTVSLKHEPDKSSANACATGETDVEATFDVNIN